MLQRTAVLAGRTSGEAFLYAESVLVPDRLPPSFRRRLDATDDPIGRILDEEGIAVTRHPEPGVGTGVCAEASDLGAALDACLLVRTYRIDVESDPVMQISEWFLSSLERFLLPGTRRLGVRAAGGVDQPGGGLLG